MWAFSSLSVQTGPDSWLSLRTRLHGSGLVRRASLFCFETETGARVPLLSPSCKGEGDSTLRSDSRTEEERTREVEYPVKDPKISYVRQQIESKVINMNRIISSVLFK